MKREYIKWTLVVAVTLGLGLSTAACSDDDNAEQREPGSATNISGTIEEDMLRHLICLWCDVQKDELVGDWYSKTYEPTVGVVTDESQPHVRSIQVDSIQGADSYAVDCFGAFGINGEKPDGFSYANDKVGKVSYHHSTEPNTLAVIDFEGISQMPGLQQIRLVRDLGDNANNGPAYYKVGDIIMYKNRLWICTNHHRASEKAKFITFTSPEDCDAGTFNWSGVGKDSVYTTEMADATTLIEWISNILIDDKYFYGDKHSNVENRSIYDILGAEHFDHMIHQVVPQTIASRRDLVRNIFNPTATIADVSGIATLGLDCIWRSNEEEVEAYNRSHNLVREQDKKPITYRMAPHGYMLSNKMRYAIGSITNTSWHQWVPYVKCVTHMHWGQVFETLESYKSQRTLDPDHFQWMYKIVYNYNSSDSLTRMGDIPGTSGKFYAYTAAFYWQHEKAYLEHDPDPATVEQIGPGPASYVLMDFTRDWKNHPTPYERRPYLQDPSLWTGRNITSKEMSFTDNGREKSGYVSVFIRPSEPAN